MARYPRVTTDEEEEAFVFAKPAAPPVDPARRPTKEYHGQQNHIPYHKLPHVKDDAAQRRKVARGDAPDPHWWRKQQETGAMRASLNEPARLIKLHNLQLVREEQTRLYRMLYAQEMRLSKDQWDRARQILIDVRNTILAESGKSLPGTNVTASITNNTIMVAAGLQRTDELLTRFARVGEKPALEGVVQDGSVLPAKVHSK
jgi:hypothetical protein